VAMWRGHMDWPVDPTWRCPICGQSRLIWGVVHGWCRCFTCHAVYTMFSADHERLTTPRTLVREDSYQAFKLIWERHHIPFDLVTPTTWQEVFAELGFTRLEEEVKNDETSLPISPE